MAGVADIIQTRARKSLGSSSPPIYLMVAAALRARGIAGGRLVDVGCGRGALWEIVGREFAGYRGLDAVRYEGFPGEAEFDEVDLNQSDWSVPAAEADVVVAIETIEHLENPWALVRGLVRLAKPGGWIVVTTPNQLSALSLMTLVIKRRFSNFQDTHYPAHRTALLESDLRRVAADSRLEEVAIEYSLSGRVPLTRVHYPRALARHCPWAFSDNVLMIGRTPAR
jgi:2-polyprenyl-3-methyl-5-hydroxy-6-metoxy-1,4-benzoquinol methylase